MRKLTIWALAALAALAISSSASAAVVPVPYTALGDSYSAGEGNSPFDGNCHRALHDDSAYPRILPGLVGFVGTPNFHACTGAVIADVWQRAQPHRKNQLTQIEYVRRQDRLVTLTIGGNDLHFSKIILRCYLFPNCNRGKFAAGIEAELPTVREELVTAYREIVARMSPEGYLVVAGYPRLFWSGNPGCKRLISANEATWINGLVTRGNREIAAAVNAARQSGGHIFYVEVADDFDGHELCSEHPWLHNPFLSFQEGPKLITGSYHPNQDGQKAYAEAIAAFLELPGVREAITAGPSPRSAYSAW